VLFNLLSKLLYVPASVTNLCVFLTQICIFDSVFLEKTTSTFLCSI